MDRWRELTVAEWSERLRGGIQRVAPPPHLQVSGKTINRRWVQGRVHEDESGGQTVRGGGGEGSTASASAAASAAAIDDPQAQAGTTDCVTELFCIEVAADEDFSTALVDDDFAVGINPDQRFAECIQDRRIGNGRKRCKHVETFSKDKKENCLSLIHI